MSQGQAPAEQHGSSQIESQQEAIAPEYADMDDDVGGAEEVGQPPSSSVPEPESRERQVNGSRAAELKLPSRQQFSEGQRNEEDPLGHLLDPPTQPGDDFPPDLLRESGLTKEQAIQNFGSVEGLQKAIADYDQQMLQRGRQVLGYQTPTQPMGVQPPWGFQQQQPNQFNQFQQPPQQQWGPPPQQQQQQPPPQFGPQQGQQQPVNPFAARSPADIAPFRAPMDLGEGWDDESKQALNQLNDHYAHQAYQQNRREQFLENAVTQMVEFVVGQQQNQTVQQYDDWFNGLGAEWKPVFGEGTRSELNPQGAEYRDRSRLVQAAEALKQGYISAGFSPPPQKTLLKKALNAEFGERSTKIVRQQLQDQVKHRRTQTISRPTNSQGKARTGEESAAAKINQILKLRGVAISNDDEPDPEV